MLLTLLGHLRAPNRTQRTQPWVLMGGNENRRVYPWLAGHFFTRQGLLKAACLGKHAGTPLVNLLGTKLLFKTLGGSVPCKGSARWLGSLGPGGPGYSRQDHRGRLWCGSTRWAWPSRSSLTHPHPQKTTKTEAFLQKMKACVPRLPRFPLKLLIPNPTESKAKCTRGFKCVTTELPYRKPRFYSFSQISCLLIN